MVFSKKPMSKDTNFFFVYIVKINSQSQLILNIPTLPISKCVLQIRKYYIDLVR